MRITGSTQVYGIAADPIEQVRAPEVFNQVFQNAGIDAVLVPLHVPAGRIVEFVPQFFSAVNARGLLLSIPHKSDVLPLLRHCDDLGRAAGAVNAIRRHADGGLEGGQFDGVGFVRGLDADGIDYRGRCVLIVGAGGAGAAIAAGLAQGGASSIALYDPQFERASAVAARVEAVFGVPCRAVTSVAAHGYRLVVNATPLGLRVDDPLPFDPASLDAGAAVCDILMKNQPTPLLRAAAASGHPVQPGFQMLLQQVEPYLEFFGLATAQSRVHVDRDALRELLIPTALRYPHAVVEDRRDI